MRTDLFRRSVFLSIGLLAAGTLLVSDLLAAPAQAFIRRPPYAPGSYGRSIDRQALRQRIARQQRASRSGTRQRVVPAPTPKPATAAARAGDALIWQRLRNCEAGGRYDRNSGNGYYGAYQFSAGTWRGLGYKGLPHQAPPEVQDEAARKLQARSGWGQWPACARRIGAR
ncbi:MAG TPA: transglycosylase family protein [Acidimicrobiia bacterium]|nr:transglycosylase family protein [Acidimicrobiia bacterium]